MKTRNWLFLLIGITLIMIAVLLEVALAPFLERLETSFFENPEEATNVMKDISLFVAKCCSPIGITLIVTYFTRRFQKSKEYDEYFSQKLDDLYQKEVASKISNSLDNFITNKENIQHIDHGSRKELIKNLLHTDAAYDGYCDKVINDLYENRKNYRNTAMVSVDAYVDKKTGKVCANLTVQYCASINSGARDIEQTFLSEMSSEIEYIELTDPNDANKRHKILHKEIILESRKAHGSSLEYVNELRIPQDFLHLESIKVTKSIRFVGLDHWINCGWMNAVPTQGFTFALHCTPDLVIREQMIFDGTNIYTINDTDFLNKPNASFQFSTIQWVNPNTGVIVTVGKKDYSFNSNTISADNKEDSVTNIAG